MNRLVDWLIDWLIDWSFTAYLYGPKNITSPSLFNRHITFSWRKHVFNTDFLPKLLWCVFFINQTKACRVWRDWNLRMASSSLRGVFKHKRIRDWPIHCVLNWTVFLWKTSPTQVEREETSTKVTPQSKSERLGAIEKWRQHSILGGRTRAPPPVPVSHSTKIVPYNRFQAPPTDIRAPAFPHPSPFPLADVIFGWSLTE